MSRWVGVERVAVLVRLLDVVLSSSRDADIVSSYISIVP